MLSSSLELALSFSFAALRDKQSLKPIPLQVDASLIRTYFVLATFIHYKVPSHSAKYKELQSASSFPKINTTNATLRTIDFVWKSQQRQSSYVLPKN